MIIDVAYVGNTVKHKFVQVDANSIAPFTEWTPTGGNNNKLIDPTSAGKAFYAINLVRPYAGYGAIDYDCSCGAANYHSLQAQVNKRLGKRLQFGANWTWAKTMTYGTRSPWTSDRLQYAEVSSDRPQVVNINYNYYIPDGSRFFGRKQVAKVLLDGWHFNGVT